MHFFSRRLDRETVVLTLVVVLFSVEGAALPGAPLWIGGHRHSSIIGESALVDKETGRIFWEGGESTLTASVFPKLRTHLGLYYLRASLLSVILILAVARIVASWLKVTFDQSTILQKQPRPFHVSVIFFLVQSTLFAAPQFEPWFIVSIAILYILEAYLSDTRRYLANALPSPNGVEDYLERLREVSPVVEWKVRSFQYQVRPFMAPLAVLFHGYRRLRQQLSSPEDHALPEWIRRKKVHQVAAGTFHYQKCVDKTVAGVWKRAKNNPGERNEGGAASPFAKIVLTKLLVLANAKSRQEYFQQQGRFVRDHCEEESMAEFSTNIHVMGFRPKLLAVRSSNTVASRFFRSHFFWIFTLFGLTVPYRLWFDSHCDEIRVSVIKETSSDSVVSKSSTNRGWFSSLTSKTLDDGSVKDDEEEVFRSFMENLKLYASRQGLDGDQQDEQEDNQLQKEEILDILQSVESAAAAAELQKEEIVDTLQSVESAAAAVAEEEELDATKASKP
jgi:hypothetical protein